MRIVKSDHEYFEVSSCALRGQRILVAELRDSPEGPTDALADIDALTAALNKMRALVASGRPEGNGGDE
jgi:hypothetical protein